MFVGIPETEIRPVIVYQQFVRGVIGCEQEEVLAAGNLSQLADFRNQKMPEYDGSRFLSDTQLFPQRTAVIIGAEMHDFHTGKGFSHPLQVVFGFFFQIIDDLVLLYMRNFGEVFFSQSFPGMDAFQNGVNGFLVLFRGGRICSNSTRKRNSSLILRNFPPSPNASLDEIDG